MSTFEELKQRLQEHIGFLTGENNRLQQVRDAEIATIAKQLGAAQRALASLNTNRTSSLSDLFADIKAAGIDAS